MKLILLLLGLLSSLTVLSQTSLITTTEFTTGKCTNVQSTSGIPQPNTSLVIVGRFPPRLLGDPYITYRTLVEFPTSIPSNAVITSAKLKMYISNTEGTPIVYAARLSAPWNDGTAIWTNQPAYETSDIVTTSSVVSNWLTFDVTNHVKKMNASAYDNNGWVLYISNETQPPSVYRRFASDNETNVTLRPKLEVSYYIPMSVSSATIVHANTSSPTETSGSISPVLINGPGGTYTYQWYNSSGVMTGKTALNLSGIPHGWYGLRVTSSIAGTAPFFYAFLVGVNCQEVPIEFNPGPDYIDDAVLKYNISPSSTNPITNYGNENAWNAVDIYNTEHLRTPIKYRLWLDEKFHFTEAKLTMKGISNENDRPNEARFKRITTEWSENIVTHSSMPGTSMDIHVNIPQMTSYTEVKTIDIINFCEFWRGNNLANYGFLFELQYYTGGLAVQSYHSSDATSSSNWPKINFLLSVSNPTSPNYCDQVFAKMDRTLRGVLYKPYLNHLYFYYDEEYNTTTSSWVNYNVYKTDAPHVSVLNHTLQPLTAVRYGDNRFTLDISDLDPATYVLEITNNKSEKFYLRFKVED